MNRRNLILTVILVLQLIVAAVVLWPRRVASGGQSLFPGVQADQVVRVTITDGQGTSIELAKQGEAWVLPGAGDYPVLEDKVPPLLDKILALTADQLVTQTPASQKRLKVADDDYERLVELELDGSRIQRLYVGTSPTYGATHIRVAGQNEVYLTSGLSTEDLGVEATAWVDRTYLEVPQDEIVALTLENANGRLEFTKAGDGWTMAGLGADETLNTSAVTSLVGRARLVSLLQPLGKEERVSYGLDNPQAVVTLQTQSAEGGSRTYTLWVGAQDPDTKRFVVKSSESAYYVQVNEYSAQDFVAKARADFLQLPPTPTPEAVPQGTPVAP
jgi:hypothetical protein